MTDNPVATIHFNSPEDDPLKVPRPLHICQEPDGTLTCWGSEAHIHKDRRRTLAGFTNPSELMTWLDPSTVLTAPDTLTGHQVEVFTEDGDGFTLTATIKEVRHA